MTAWTAMADELGGPGRSDANDSQRVLAGDQGPGVVLTPCIQ